MSINQTEFTDVLRVQGVNAKGYGILPKIPMQDSRLSPTAKLIYAYFCSFAGSGDTAFPSVKKIMFDLGIKDIDTFRKHRKQLEYNGYINVEQSTIKGVFSSNIYTLISNPEAITIDKSQLSPLPKKPVTEKTRYRKNPLPKKPVTKINSIIKINSIKNYQSVHQEEDGRTDIPKIDLSKYDSVLQPIIQDAIKALKTPDISIKNIDLALEVFSREQAQKTIKNPKLYFQKCLLSAIQEGGLKQLKAPQATSGRMPNYANFDQRTYDEKELERFYITASNRYK